jgi:hypothetical protein
MSFFGKFKSFNLFPSRRQKGMERRFPGHKGGFKPGIFRVVLLRSNIGRMGIPVANGHHERGIASAGGILFKPVACIRINRPIVIDTVCRTGTGNFYRLSGGAVTEPALKGSVRFIQIRIDGIGENIPGKTFHKAVMLVRPEEVHPPCKGGPVTSPGKHMRKCGPPGIQHVSIVKDMAFRRQKPREETHPGRNTQRTVTVGILEYRAFTG